MARTLIALMMFLVFGFTETKEHLDEKKNNIMKTGVGMA